jgi:hypothetical protein
MDHVLAMEQILDYEVVASEEKIIGVIVKKLLIIMVNI